MAQGLALVNQGVTAAAKFRFEPTPPFEAAPYRRGWRLLGAALVWQVQNAVSLEDYAKAVKAVVVARNSASISCGGPQATPRWDSR